MKKRVCKKCGWAYSEDKARCPSCKGWDNGNTHAIGIDDGTKLIVEVVESSHYRVSTGLALLDELWGGDGIVNGSVTLLGGKAGAGKSTLSIQLASTIALANSREVMYIAAEESEADIKARYTRLGLKGGELIRIFPMGNQVDVTTCLENRKPCAVFFDSLPGFVQTAEQGLELCKALKPIAVALNAPFIVIDHINKQDDFAGFEALQHAVDTLITIFPTGDDEIRELEVLKNRHGKAHINAHMLMTETGLHEIISEEDDSDDDADN